MSTDCDKLKSELLKLAEKGNSLKMCYMFEEANECVHEFNVLVREYNNNCVKKK